MYVNELIGTIHSGGGHFFPFDFPSILRQNESISTVFLHSFVTYIVFRLLQIEYQ